MRYFILIFALAMVYVLAFDAAPATAQDLPSFVDRHDHERMAGDALSSLNRLSVAA